MSFEKNLKRNALVNIRVNKIASNSVVIGSDVIDESVEINKEPEFLEVTDGSSYKAYYFIE